MKLVIKYPTRGRPDKFTSLLDRYINFLSGKNDVHFVISFDHDDVSMNNDNIWSFISRINSKTGGKIHAVCGKSHSKISAVNSDLDVVQSEEKPDWTLFRYKPKQNFMVYDRKNDYVYINYYEIWSVLEEHFGLNYTKIKELTEMWLGEVYNLRGITTYGSSKVLRTELG